MCIGGQLTNCEYYPAEKQQLGKWSLLLQRMIHRLQIKSNAYLSKTAFPNGSKDLEVVKVDCGQKKRTDMVSQETNNFAINSIPNVSFMPAWWDGGDSVLLLYSLWWEKKPQVTVI